MTVPKKLHFVCFFVLTMSTHLAIAQPPEAPRFIESDKLIVAPVEGANMFQVFSKEVGEWKSFKFPHGVEATPIIGGGVCTFKLEGKQISQIVAVDFRGNWVTFDLPKPATLCSPIISENLTVFVIDGRTYAFSAIAGRWDVIDSAAPPQVSNDVVLVVAPDWIGAFSAKTGKWSVAQTRIKAAHP